MMPALRRALGARPRHVAGRRAGARGPVVTAVLALAVAGAMTTTTAVVPPPAAAATATAPADQGCTDNVGVTVVVDFHELGGGVQARCATGSVSNGFDALTKAGIDYQESSHVHGFLCRIAGRPADDPCTNTSPPSAYWSYWIAQRGGTWCASTFGAGNRTPPPGSIEGWSFAKDKASSMIPPPGYAVPAPVPGTTPHPLAPADCGSVPAPTTVPTTTNPPVTSPPPTSGGAAGSGPSGATGGSGAAGPAGPGAGAPGQASGAAARTVPVSPGATSTGPGQAGRADGPTTPNPSADSIPADGPGTSSVSASDAPVPRPGSTIAAATSSGATETADDAIDLGASTTSSGSPAPLLLTVVLAGVLGGSAVWTSRRRRAASGTTEP